MYPHVRVEYITNNHAYVECECTHISHIYDHQQDLSIDVLIYMDDGKVTTDTTERALQMLRALEDKFKVLKVTTGNKHNYLSTVFDYHRETKTV